MPSAACWNRSVALREPRVKTRLNLVTGVLEKNISDCDCGIHWYLFGIQAIIYGWLTIIHWGYSWIWYFNYCSTHPTVGPIGWCWGIVRNNHVGDILEVTKKKRLKGHRYNKSTSLSQLDSFCSCGHENQLWPFSDRIYGLIIIFHHPGQIDHQRWG